MFVKAAWRNVGRPLFIYLLINIVHGVQERQEIYSDIVIWFGSVSAYKDTIKFARLCISSSLRKFSLSVRMKLSTSADPFLTVLILRIFCVFAEILRAIDNIVYPLCRHQDCIFRQWTVVFTVRLRMHTHGLAVDVRQTKNAWIVTKREIACK